MGSLDVHACFFLGREGFRSSDPYTAAFPHRSFLFFASENGKAFQHSVTLGPGKEAPGIRTGACDSRSSMARETVQWVVAPEFDERMPAPAEENRRCRRVAATV
jgi:hypothetical protein